MTSYKLLLFIYFQNIRAKLMRVLTCVTRDHESLNNKKKIPTMATDVSRTNPLLSSPLKQPVQNPNPKKASQNIRNPNLCRRRRIEIAFIQLVFIYLFSLSIYCTFFFLG